MKTYQVYMNEESRLFNKASWTTIAIVQAKNMQEAKHLLKGVVYGKFESNAVTLMPSFEGPLGTLRFEAQ